MWWKVKNKGNNGSSGFSLVEAMVATALMGVGFAGTFTMIAVTKNASDESIIRQKLQMISNQVLEVIESDLVNIDNYDMDLKTCITPDVGETDKFDLRQYEWCMRMQSELGAAIDAETREIDVRTLVDGRKVVHIELEARNQNVEIIMKRIYDN